MFGESKIVEYHIQESDIAPGKKEVWIRKIVLYAMVISVAFSLSKQMKQQILIDNKQHYKLLGKNIQMISLIKLYVENNKIVRHEDWY